MLRLVFAVGGVIALAPRAAAELPRVVLVDPGSALERATTLALSPRGVTVVAIAEPNPGATMPGSAEGGRSVTEAQDAVAAVWISDSDSGHALWVYDRRTDRVAARSLPGAPPFDAPTAAQIALVIQTLLFAAASEEPAAPAVAVVHGELDAVEQAPAARTDRWGLLVAGGVRAFATDPMGLDARFELGATYWPSALARVVGITLSVVSGPGLETSDETLRARWTDSSAVLSLRGRVALDAVIDLGLSLGLGARMTTLDGSASARDVPVHQVRFDPVSRVALELGLRAAPWLRFELRVGSLIPWRVQRYLVDGDAALSVNAASLRTAVGFELELD